MGTRWCLIRPSMSVGSTARSDWWFPVVTSLLAVGALLFFNNLQPGPIVADIYEQSANTVNGLTEVRISWTDPRHQAAGSRTDVVMVSPELIADGKLEMWIFNSNDGPIYRFDDPRFDLRVAEIGFAAALGALLGLVVVGSVRGYGYVRGKGEFGSMTPTEVREDRGFYWRT